MPVVKGGVWTNIEDEILKASVSKYGLNQWARVSSLLARKTPKQCKARWNEWLDPSIKKIEWSKEEDEKLLHLAKLMPTQWRTIAPIVGRTANQCLERYQKLLDEAEQRESSELGLTGPEGGETQAPSADDVRRLRPGEVDPDPESKPARPDTIDLDEDEKEMLSEARARLANTQGKKAKRKARERQQEESRRMAALQKRRELKTAGINIKVTTRKQGQMDYNADIPFEKKPAIGFYDTNEEKALNERERENFDPRKLQLSSKRKGDQDDEADRKRRKNDKDGSSASQAAMKAGQMQKIREAEQNSKRRALVLPAPQVGEGEMDEIVKMGKMGERANMVARASENDATRGLVSNYSNFNTQTPIRTPMAPASEDHIANEIKNIRALTETKSVLQGEENTVLTSGSASTGFDSIAPRKQVVATPNPLSTPLRSGMNGGETPLPTRPGQTPMRTPRDSFALNAGDGGELSLADGTPNDLRLRDLALRHQLKEGLASLPKPKQTNFDIETAEDELEAISQRDVAEEDAAERDRREREIREAQEALERRRRTQVMQRDLPRPTHVDVEALLSSAATLQSPAKAMIMKEAALLIANDAAKFPLPGTQIKGQVPPLRKVDDAPLAEARLLIMLETKGNVDKAEVAAMWEKRAERSNLVRLGLSAYEKDDEEEVAVMREAAEDIHPLILSAAQSGSKLEKKLSLHLGGYIKRQKVLSGKLSSASTALDEARAALGSFKTLQISEEVAIARRLEALREEVSFISRREREAQEAYKRLRDELDGVTGGALGVNGYY